MQLMSSVSVVLGLTGLGLAAVAGGAIPATASEGTAKPSAARTVPGTSQQAFTWGSNSDGRLGIGSLDDSAPAPVPTGVGGNSSDRWVAIDAGYNHTCGVGADGSAYCWGVNRDGQLGDGTTDDDSVPGAVNSNEQWQAISAGGGYFGGVSSHSCGITASGAIYCWGSNNQGQLGIPHGADQVNPQVLPGGFDWRAISAGGDHTCAIAVDGSAYCWGDNNSGQLGFGAVTDFEDSPALVAGGHVWKRISAGNNYSCGVTTSGQGYCWGHNADAQLGLGTSGSTDDSLPARVLDGASGESTWSSIAAGDLSTCGTSSGGAAFCWGRNYYGQLGNGTTNPNSDDSVPVAVLAPMTSQVLFVEPATNNETACGITSSGAYCWGYNGLGSLGDPVYQGDSSVPIPVAAMWQSPGIVPRTLSMGGDFSLLLVGSSTPAPTPDPPVAQSSPPREVVGVAGRASADVSWLAPASTGSYPVTHYLMTSSPGSRTCLVAAPILGCTVDGLTNGTSYTFTVKALTGAGWSAASEPSNAVVPRADSGPAVMITGSRDGDRIQVSGTTAGFGMGGTLRPWLRMPGQSAHSEGSATILVSMDGTFEWSRRTGKRVSVYVATPDGSVWSNTVVIAAR